MGIINDDDFLFFVQNQKPNNYSVKFSKAIILAMYKLVGFSNEEILKFWEEIENLVNLVVEKEEGIPLLKEVIDKNNVEHLKRLTDPIADTVIKTDRIANKISEQIKDPIKILKELQPDLQKLPDPTQYLRNKLPNIEEIKREMEITQKVGLKIITRLAGLTEEDLKRQSELIEEVGKDKESRLTRAKSIADNIKMLYERFRNFNGTLLVFFDFLEGSGLVEGGVPVYYQLRNPYPDMYKSIKHLNPRNPHYPHNLKWRGNKGKNLSDYLKRQKWNGIKKILYWVHEPVRKFRNCYIHHEDKAIQDRIEENKYGYFDKDKGQHYIDINTLHGWQTNLYNLHFLLNQILWYVSQQRHITKGESEASRH